MFCTNCGNELEEKNKFCSSCGAKTLQLNEKTISSSEIKQSSLIPDFGKLATKVWGPVRHRRPFSSAYSWIELDNTLLVFDNHFVLINDPDRKLRSIHDSAEWAGILMSSGFVGYVIGAAVSGIGKSIIGSVSNALTPSKLDAIHNLFDNHKLLWSTIEDAELWEVHFKTLGFMKSKLRSLFCPFKTPSGDINCLIELDNVQSTLSIGSPFARVKTKIISECANEKEAKSRHVDLILRLPKDSWDIDPYFSELTPYA